MAFATQTEALTKADILEKAKEVATTARQDVPTVVLPGQAFVGDYRSTSALCVGDGITNHTAKWMQKELGVSITAYQCTLLRDFDCNITYCCAWCIILQGTQTSPLEFIQASEPIKVHGLVVASYGSDDPALGCPAEYINLKGTTYESPAVCKYTGNRYYSDSWKEGGSH